MSDHRAGTICAVATAPGRGGVGIVRCSGPLAAGIARHITGRVPSPRSVGFRRFRDQDGSVIDTGLLLYFPGPASYTGEDVIECQVHGSPVVLQRLLACMLRMGARPAGPGEFTERAFLNGKLDLAQAEAVADLINASSIAAAKAAAASLEGVFSRQVAAIADDLVGLRVRVEALIDFPDEGLDETPDPDLAKRLQEMQEAIAGLTERAEQGRRLRESATVVIVGQANAGKSTLLNALAGDEVAIVTDIPGTTRDVLRQEILIDGLPLQLWDTAGLRDSDDPVEQEGIRRTRRALASADHVILVIDDSARGREPDLILPADRVTRVFAKIDLSGRPPGPADAGWAVSALTGAGLDALRKQLHGLFQAQGGIDSFSARTRHVDALRVTADCLHRAAGHQRQGQHDLVAEELGLAHRSLTAVTGAFTSEDLLGEIFSRFCIGK